jgi:hypothetical protein
MIGHYEYCIHAALSVSNDSKIRRLVVTKVANESAATLSPGEDAAFSAAIRRR